MKTMRVMLIAACLFAFLLPGRTLAHASLLEAAPAPDSRWDEPPESVVLTFNERLENGLFFINVLNSRGEAVTKEQASMSGDRRTVSLRLPRLADGVYTISYKVVSADGHPVGGSYVIVVGGAAAPPAEGSIHLSHNHGPSRGMSAGEFALYASRFLYYVSLLLLIGWAFWRCMARGETERLRKLQDQGVLVLLRVHVPALMLMIAMQLPEWTGAWTKENILALLGTAIGVSWLASGILAVAGFYVLNRSRAADLIWIAMLAAAKSLNGHAMAFEPQFAAAASDVIHLLASSVWAGGLVYALILWKTEKTHAMPFLLKFSRAAFVSMAVLAASGAASVALFLPKAEYVLFTSWGMLLLCKTALVGFVLLAGAAVRRKLRKGEGARTGLLLGIDGALMLAIVAVVAVFTYASPLPANEQLHWHVMGETAHMTANIAPNVPGQDNDFEVIVWLPEGEGEPKRVQLRLRYAEDPEFAPIDVPLAPSEKDVPYVFPGFDRYDFEAKGRYLPFPGRWELEVRVLDANDNEIVYNRELRVF